MTQTDGHSPAKRHIAAAHGIQDQFWWTFSCPAERNQQRKLFPAKPDRKAIRRPNCLNCRGHTAQDVIASIVTQFIIDCLEVIQIDQHQAVQLGPTNRQIHKGAAVEQAS